MKRFTASNFRAAAASAAVFLAAAILVGCGVPEDSSPRPLNLGEPTTTRNYLPTEPSVLTLDENEEFVTIYFDSDQGDQQISGVLRLAEQPVMPEDILEILLAGPSERETEEGFVSYLPAASELLNTRTEGSVFVANFRSGSRLEELSGMQMYLAAGQIVLSITENSDIEGVLVEIGGSALTLPSNRGDLNTPARSENYQDLLVLPIPLDNLIEPPFPPPAAP